jgi:Heparinase II/III-like protein/Heparinase II/III N-terminus
MTEPSGGGERPAIVLTRRGREALHVVVAAALTVAVVTITGLGTSSGGPDDSWADLAPRAAIQAAPCPSASSIDLPPLNPEGLVAARSGTFQVFGPDPTELSPPIDWTADPLGAHRYRQNLHKLRFLSPLLAGYRETGNRDDLSLALAIALDWVEQNGRAAPDTPMEAWADKVVGDRVPFLAYLLRVSACEGLATAQGRGALLAALEEHGRVLASGERYVPDNHGLFVDLGLLRLVRFLPFLPARDEWSALARSRFEQTLRARLADGIWLEHSSAYQFLVIRAVERMLDVHGADAELSELLAEMRAAASWLVRPDGELAQFGDSNLEPVPDWALAEASETSGLSAHLRAGLAFVRADGPDGVTGYLAVTDGFHNLTHKHADELSFELFDRETAIVTDTGLYDKDPGPIRDFVVSNRAHSTLTVDGLDLPISDPDAAYGSGLLAAGEGEGWYAVAGENRLLEAQGVRHRRLFAYKPGEALVIVDRIEAESPHTYTRYLQLGRRLTAAPRGAQVEITERDFEGSITDAGGGGPTSRSVTRGQGEPIQGFTAPHFRQLVPRWTVAYANAASTATLLTTISLSDAHLRATEAAVGESEWDIALTDSAGNEQRIAVARDGEGLAIASSGP